MKKNVSKTRKEILVPLLATLAVILVVVAIFQPWWSVRTSPEMQLLSNSTMTVDMNLFKTLNVVRTDGTNTDTLAINIINTTAYQSPVSVKAYPFSYVFRTITTNRTDNASLTSFAFSFNNLTSFQDQTRQIFGMTYQTMLLMLVGLALAIATVLMTTAVTRTDMAIERYTYLVGVLAVILLLIAPLGLAFSVTSFSGSLQIAAPKSVWDGETLLTWGPSVGWFLSIAAALITAVCLLPIRTIYSDRKRGIQSLK